jgi:hypothetical protein
LRPRIDMMITMAAIVSGTLATEVRRWCQKWPVPLCADPR